MNHLIIDDLGILKNHRFTYIDVLVLNKELVVHITTNFTISLHDLFDSNIDEVVVGVDLLFHQTSCLFHKYIKQHITLMNSGMRCHLSSLSGTPGAYSHSRPDIDFSFSLSSSIGK